ncbi:MAG: tetratricopeptide repeat protein [Gammaproteobacteria bacterium]|nr:tetratricopeptide repeat protein [Gammaproteobacteria bacterium]
MPRRISDTVFVSTLTVAWVLAGCAGPSASPPQTGVGDAAVFESSAIPEDLLLDVGISIFDAPDPGLDADQESVFHSPEVLRAERNYVPYVVGRHLEATGAWGAVRILTRPSAAIDVTVSGSIERSDGEVLAFRARATDARGIQWFDNEYRTLVGSDGYDADQGGRDPFAGAYAAFAADMVASLKALSLDDLVRIRTVAELAFARSLAPEAFAKHVTPNPDGGHELRRLPAAGDPALARVREIRHREHLVIDTINDYYDDFTTSIQGSYDKWRREAFRSRQAQRELKVEVDAQVLLGSARIIAGLARLDHDMPGRQGFGWVTRGLGLIRGAEQGERRIRDHEAALREVGVSTEANLLPYSTALENRTMRLQRGVDSQYNALREVLHRTFQQENGSLPDAPRMPLSQQPSPDHPTMPKARERRVLPPAVAPPPPAPSVAHAAPRAHRAKRTLNPKEKEQSGDVQEALDLLNQLLDDEEEDLGTFASARIYTVMALGQLAQADDQGAVTAFNEVVVAACATVCIPRATQATATSRRRHYPPLRPKVFQFLANVQEEIAYGEFDYAIELLGDLTDAKRNRPRSGTKPNVAKRLGVYRLRPVERAAAYQVMARMYVAKQDYENAIETYKNILAMGRKAPPWHHDMSNENLALIHFSQKNYEQSLAYQRAWLDGSEWLGQACPRVCPAGKDDDSELAALSGSEAGSS